MTFPTYEEWCEKVAEQAIDGYIINGRTIREWIEILSDELTMLDKIRAEIEQITDTMGVRYNQYVSKIDVLQIIDRYRRENDE